MGSSSSELEVKFFRKKYAYFSQPILSSQLDIWACKGADLNEVIEKVSPTQVKNLCYGLPINERNDLVMIPTLQGKWFKEMIIEQNNLITYMYPHYVIKEYPDHFEM